MNKNKLFRRILTTVLSVVMILGMLPVTALAAGEIFNADISQGDVSVSSEGVISYYNSDGSLTESGYSSGDCIVITGTSTEHTVTIDGAYVDITLDGVDIQLTTEETCAFELKNGATVNLTLEENTANILKSGPGCAGISVPKDTTVIIDGTGSLDASSRTSQVSSATAAGIGGNDGKSAGTITIMNGTVTATGVYASAGIGGGASGDGGTVTISGGTVTAIGDGNNDNGIGGGYYGENGDCYISGGSVRVTSMGPTPQISVSDNTTVYLTTVTLDGIDEKTEISSLSVTYDSDDYSYGTNNMYTDESGKIYLWLPEGATVTGAEVDGISYAGSVITTDDNEAAGTLTASGGSGDEDNTAPTVGSVTPSGTDAATSGDVVITFNEAMDTNEAGTVSLDKNVGDLGSGDWSKENTEYTVSYSGLDSETEYTIAISDFKDTAGNVMTEDTSNSFTTKASGDSSIWDGATDTTWYNNTDTEFIITTAKQLAGFAELVNGGNDFSGKTVKLGADIALNDVSNVSEWATTAPSNIWTPIGEENKPFKGIFNGYGHTISGIYKSSYEYYQSLFSWIVDAKIINLGVTASYIKGYMYTAGVVAYSDSSTVKNVCVTNSYIESSYYFAAGVVAYNASASGTVQNCYNTGIVKGFSGLAAGVVCYNDGTVQNCYNTGIVKGLSGAVAGVVRYNSGTVQNCYYDETICGETSDDDAKGKTTDWMKNATNISGIEGDDSTFNEWDTSIWVFESGKYPYLKSIATDADTVDAAKTAAAGATYDPIKQADAPDEGAVKGIVEKIAKEAVNDDTVTVTITDGSYTAPTAGTSANPNGTDGSYSFTVTVKKGTQSATTEENTVTIIATEYVDSDTLTGTATITGDALFGKTLTASLTDGNSTGTLSYQWTRGGQDISGATESTYTLTKDDVGAVIGVKITSDDKTGTRTSAATSEVGKADYEGTASAPFVLERTNTTVTLVEKEGYEYGVYNKEKDTVVWQDSNTFTGLKDGTTYSFYQRIKETDTHKASDSSDAVTIDTQKTIFYKWNYDGAAEYYTTQAADSDEKLTAPTTPQRAGYTFDGWYQENTCENPWNFNTNKVEGSMNLFAKWKEKTSDTLEVTYADGGATSGKVPKGRSNYKSGDTVTVFGNKGSLSKSGASFAGWSDGTTTYKEGETFTITDNTVLTAVWTEKTTQCTVTFNSNYAEGGTYTTQTVTYGSLLTKPATPTREGYSFIGWYKDAACTNPWSFGVDTVTDNMTLYTKWAQGTYSVSGTVVDDTTPSPNKVEAATVKIMKGNIQFGDTVLTDADGKFTVTGVPNGEYNIIITKNGRTVTLHIKVDGSDFTYEGQITLPKGNKNSKLDIVGSDTPNVVEDGLHDLFKDSEIYDEESIKAVNDGGAVEIRLMVQKDDNAPEKEIVSAQMSSDGYESGIMLDVNIEKTVTNTNGGISDQSQITSLDDTLTLIIPLPTELQGKSNYVVYRTHDYGGTIGVMVDKITTTLNANKEYIEISGDKTYLTLHAKFFSTYAIGYSEDGDKKKKHSSGSSTITTQSYTINVKGSDGGSISPSGSVSVEKGKDKTFTFTSKDGYIISDVLIDGKSVGAVDSYTFKNMDAAHSISVVFATEKAEGLPYYLDSNDKIVFIGFASDVSGTMKYIAPDGETVQFVQNPKSFNDISGHWAKSNIKFITQREIFVGTEPNTFAPNSGMTRAMFATVIGRLYERSYGKITATGNKFSDVPEDAYYSTYVSWAEKNEVIKGVGGNKFDPNRQITREEMAAILYRFAEFLKVSEGSSDTKLEYTDIAKIDAWAMESVKYCQENKIVVGRNDGSFAPQDTATRAEVATILKRFVETVVK